MPKTGNIAAILHFPTYYLPDNAVVTEVILMVKGQGVIGTDPFTTHQNILVDIRSGVFGSFGPWGIEERFKNPIFKTPQVSTLSARSRTTTPQAGIGRR